MPTSALEARPQGGPADDVARSGEEADGRRRGRQPEEARQREPCPGRARFLQDAAQA